MENLDQEIKEVTVPLFCQDYKYSKSFKTYPSIFVTLQYNDDESESVMIEKLSFSIEKNNLKLQGQFEKAARLKLWSFDTDDRKPLVFKEFNISRPVLHEKYISVDHTID